MTQRHAKRAALRLILRCTHAGQCSTSNVSVDESLQMCVQTEFTDEITATPVSGIPHRLRLRRMQARKHSNHTVNSGLYMSPADLAVLDVQVDKTDVERSYTHVVVDEHIEPKMKRPRLMTTYRKCRVRR